MTQRSLLFRNSKTASEFKVEELVSRIRDTETVALSPAIVGSPVGTRLK